MLQRILKGFRYITNTLKNQKLNAQLSELPFYEELNVIKTNHVFRGYAKSQKFEIIEKKDPIKQLEASKY